MSLRVDPAGSFRAAVAARDRATVGMWVCSGSPVAAEICAGSGLDWVLIDTEHAPNGLESVLAQLHAASGYPVHSVVRLPAADDVAMKQVLDLGATTVLVPMVNTREQAERVAASAAYPPEGVRGVGSALARAARWNRVEGYLAEARAGITVLVQAETEAAVANAAEIAAVPGIDGVFIGPSDLAASMGLLGQQDHPEVVAAVLRTIAAVHAAGKPVGVNAFAPATAERYLAAGVDFILVGADVALLARGGEALAARYLPEPESPAAPRASY
ncbi:HpcH/HpaI aldolase family protein [Leucobacter sp. M11]|uniref:HpcH/HpaI aldolase family protein n=1 Tax=Leucobacter sp. M11 TaxID=2993565 RepID=UPI002D803F8C|nr:aldolase/citrate lyase family protein [Leucobacter sp. M11]